MGIPVSPPVGSAGIRRRTLPARGIYTSSLAEARQNVKANGQLWVDISSSEIFHNKNRH
jgi:hypothetical protein